MIFETIIGLEIHIELNTRSKMFCACSTEFGAQPNANTCPVCLGMPGTYPVLNKEAVRLALRAARALNCRINKVSCFNRKNYFYPDLPKGYQITQFELPLCEDGFLEFESEAGNKKSGRAINHIEISRIHLEEDAGKLMHPEDQPVTLVDYNRAGVPLIEIVTRPKAIRPQAAVDFLKELKSVMEYTGVSDCRMEQGSLRCDVNISVRRKGEKELGTKVEIKNLNSFKEIHKAMEWEMQRQQELLLKGKKVMPETRRWDQIRGVTIPMRTKNGSQQYYITPEPDLPGLDLKSEIFRSYLEEPLPELRAQKNRRFMEQYNLSRYEAEILTQNKGLADYYETVVKHGAAPVDASNWILVELLRLWNPADNAEIPVSGKALAQLIKLVNEGRISRNAGKKVLDEMFETGKSPRLIIEEKGLAQISSRAEIEIIVDQVLKQNKDAVEEYKTGRTKVAGFLMGQIMKAGRGRLNPNVAREILEEKLK